MHVLYVSWNRIAFCSLIVASLAGCGKNGVERVTISGKVTFRGQPVPSGIISFTPDAKKGNRGPQGVAKIADGHYTTNDHGKGSVRGPQLVEIRGYGGSGGPGRGDSLPFSSGQRLFSPFFTEADVKDGSVVLDFDVPDNAATRLPK